MQTFANIIRIKIIIIMYCNVQDKRREENEKCNEKRKKKPQMVS